MDELTEKIRSMTLSRTEKRIADYILENISTIGLQTVSNVAAGIGTSDTSVIRFIRRLGFLSYADFKRKMGEMLVDQYHEAAWGSQKYIQTKEAINQSDLIADVAACAMNNLRKTCEGLSREKIEEATAILMKSRFKYIIGFRTAGSCSLYMQGKLRYLQPNVVCVERSESEAIERLIDITKDDCVLMYSFPPYSEVNKTILEIAGQKKAPTILITDQVTSPLAAKADLVLSASISGLGFTNSYIAPICVSEILLFSINAKINDHDGERAMRIDQYLAKHKAY